MMTRKRAITALALCCLFSLAAACGNGSPKCAYTGLNVMPAAATADHAGVPPANAVRFAAFGTGLPEGCVAPASSLTNVTWSVSDTANVSISNAADQSFGVATCTGATSGPVTVTATLPAVQNSGREATGTATLTCN